MVTIKQELQFFEPPIEDDYSRQQRHQQQLDYNRQELLQEYYQDYDYIEDLPLTQTGRRNKNKNGGKRKQKRRKRKSDYDDDEEDLDFDASIKEEYDSSNAKSKEKSEKKRKSDESSSDSEDSEEESDPEFQPKKRKRGPRTKSRNVKNDDASFEEEKKPKVASFKTEGERDWTKKYQCPDCIKGYNARRDLNNHRARHLSGGKGWKCLQCEDKTFGRR